MRNALSHRIRHSRISLAVILALIAVTLTPGVTYAVEDPDTVAKATGGGTVLAAPLYNTSLASFGLNARRAVDFVPGSSGPAVGRISYDRHRNSTGRHFNVPVAFMQASVDNPPSPNGTGGSATIIGDCMAVGATCPPGSGSAKVTVDDNSDSGAGTDTFRITFCSGLAALSPEGCGAFEGGTLRTGNIQIRGEAGVAGEQIATSAAAGVFSTTPTFNGVELAGGIYGIGVRTGSDSAYGDLHAEFTGISLIGLYQIISVNAWITSATVVGGTTTLSGTASLDMGDGPPPTGGLSFTGTLTATGLSITVAGSTIPTLPKTDGFTTIE